jgi:acid stress-induced BolA-like protein IbaG/YrbA
MDDAELKQVLQAGLDDCEVEIQIDGNKVALGLVSGAFAGLSRVKRQQLVYGLLKDRIESGEIHAVTMRTQTPEEKAGD